MSAAATRPLSAGPDFVCVGLNHETSPLEVRDALVMNEQEVERALRELRERASAAEALVLSTCNRTEIYARGVTHPDPTTLVAALLREIKGVELLGRGAHLYTFREPDSMRHLFRVACGLNSQVLGEPQILGQVKDAMELAGRLGGAGPVTARLLDAALRCAKRARSETGIGRGPVSAPFAAVNLAAKVLGNLTDKRALLIGAGEMAGLAAKHLMETGLRTFVIANRSRERGEALGRCLAARVVSLEAIPVLLPGADIVVGATSAPGVLVTESMVRTAMKLRRNRPLLIFDLAVPRDVDPAAAPLPNVFLHDLDALGAIVAQSLDQRRAEVPKAESIVDQEVARFLRWYRSLELKPTITAFRGHFERVAREEVERHKGRFRPEDRPALEALAHGIIQKLLHRPTTRLSRSEEDGADTLSRIDALRDLFDLGEDEDADRNPR
ncbi:MAG TPA: glutamyl-tRNA reductase [Candidatus Eisenbacteria bacterium]